MRFIDIFLGCFIVCIIIILSLSSFIIFQLDDIRENWDKYRCNPIMMPFAPMFGQDAISNFNECVKSTQINFISIFLAPIFGFVRGIIGLLGSLTDTIQNIREKVFDILNDGSSIFSQIYGLFLNTMIQFQRIMITARDTINKILATFVIVINTLQAGALTGRSIVNGPVGSVINFLCFHPNTPVPMLDGSIKNMKDIEIGEQLQHGAKVLAVLKIHGNSKDNPYYRLYSSTLGTSIYVTGSHIMKDPESGSFKKVSEISAAILEDTIFTNRMSCLITEDHEIHIGEYVFKDWEYF